MNLDKDTIKATMLEHLEANDYKNKPPEYILSQVPIMFELLLKKGLVKEEMYGAFASSAEMMYVINMTRGYYGN